MKNLASAADLEEILDRLQRLSPQARALWGRMNPHQAMCHLSDSYMAATGEKPASAADGWFERNIMKWLALYAPVPWPKGIPTRPEMEQGVGGTPPGEFERDRAALAALIQRFSRPAPDFAWRPHPVFGRLSASEWLRWGYLHADHHLRQFGV